MSDSISYADILNRMAAERSPGKADPRLVEIARYLARRAAERDYKRQLEKAAANKKLNKDEDS